MDRPRKEKSAGVERERRAELGKGEGEECVVWRRLSAEEMAEGED